MGYQGLILGPMLFNIFINHLDDRIESTLTMSANDRKLGGERDTTEGEAILQRDLDRMEEWARNNCVKFNTSIKSCTWHISKDPSTG